MKSEFRGSRLSTIGDILMEDAIFFFSVFEVSYSYVSFFLFFVKE